MEKSQKWIIGIIITLIISLGTVAVLHWFPHQWCVNSLSTDGLACLLGAIITSVVTLGALFITTRQTRRQIEESNKRYKLDLVLKLSEKISNTIISIDAIMEKEDFSADSMEKIIKNINSCSTMVSLFSNKNTEDLKTKLKNIGGYLNNLYNIKKIEKYEDDKYKAMILATKDNIHKEVIEMDNLAYDLIHLNLEN